MAASRSKAHFIFPNLARLLKDGKHRRDGHEKTALGHSLGRDFAELPAQVGGLGAARQGVVECVGDTGYRGGRFMNELHAEVADAGIQPVDQMRGGFLRFRAEDGVAAANVGHDGMGSAVGIAEFHAVMLAGTAAIAIAGPGGEEAAEDAMLSVEDGKVLVDDGFYTLRAGAASELADLGGVEIVSGARDGRGRG